MRRRAPSRCRPVRPAGEVVGGQPLGEVGALDDLPQPSQGVEVRQLVGAEGPEGPVGVEEGTGVLAPTEVHHRGGAGTGAPVTSPAAARADSEFMPPASDRTEGVRHRPVAAQECGDVDVAGRSAHRRRQSPRAGRWNASRANGPPTYAASALVLGRAGDPVGERLGVVLRVVAQRATRLEVPPGAGVGADAVEHREAGGGRGQRRLDHPHAVVVGEPGRQVRGGWRARRGTSRSGRRRRRCRSGRRTGAARASAATLPTP